MNPLATLLIKTLRLDPALTELDLLLRLAQHVREALELRRYRIGSAEFPITRVPEDIAARVTLTNALTPYLNAHGDVTDPNGTRYHLESRRYLYSQSNTATVNDVVIPGGLVLHLEHVAADVQVNVKALVTIAYIFHASAETPAITLLSDLPVGVIDAVTLKTLEPHH